MPSCPGLHQAMDGVRAVVGDAVEGAAAYAPLAAVLSVFGLQLMGVDAPRVGSALRPESTVTPCLSQVRLRRMCDTF